MALAVLTHRWATARGGRILALIVDHGLRPESADEAHATGRRLDALGIEHATLLWSGDKPTTGVEEAARSARLALLAERCRDEGILHLALAHHRDDQAETVMLRLARGSGVDGLAGIASVRNDGYVRLIRPLLGEPREAMRALCRAESIEWVEDPSNASTQYARGRLRAAAGVLATEGLRPEGLADTARRAARARNALEQATSAVLARAASFHPEGWVSFDPHALLNEPEEIALRSLAHAIGVVGGSVYAPRDDSVRRLLEQARAGMMRGRTLGGCVVATRKGAIIVAREPDAATQTSPLTAQTPLLWDRRFVLSLDRHCTGRFTVARLGESGWRQAAEWRDDLLCLDMPLAARLALPGLWVGQRLAGVPGFQGRYPPQGAECPALAVFTPPVTASSAPFPVV